MTDQIVLPSEGITFLIEWMLKSAIAGTVDSQLLLFQPPLNPECDVVFSDLVECDFDGYDRITLNRSGWQTPTVEDCCAIMLYGSSPISWTNLGGPQDIGGYAVLYPVGNVLLMVQALSTPFTLPTLVTMSLRPQFTLTTGACPVF